MRSHPLLLLALLAAGCHRAPVETGPRDVKDHSHREEGAATTRHTPQGRVTLPPGFEPKLRLAPDRPTPPEALARAAVAIVAERTGLPPEQLVIGNYAIARYPVQARSFHAFTVFDERATASASVLLDDAGREVDRKAVEAAERAPRGNLGPEFAELFEGAPPPGTRVAVTLWVRSTAEPQPRPHPGAGKEEIDSALARNREQQERTGARDIQPLSARLRELGARIDGEDASMRLVRATVPVEKLEAIARWPELSGVTLSRELGDAPPPDAPRLVARVADLPRKPLTRLGRWLVVEGVLRTGRELRLPSCAEELFLVDEPARVALRAPDELLQTLRGARRPPGRVRVISRQYVDQVACPEVEGVCCNPYLFVDAVEPAR